MLTELCQELRNWFDRDQPKFIGEISISNNVISKEGQQITIKNGQYFRVVGSVFNDGVHKNDSSLGLVDEDFTGSVWLMAIPQAVLALDAEINAWTEKYGEIDSVNMSPYNSESFGGYSYSKSGGGSGASAGSVVSWKDTFRARLNLWRKI